MYFTWRHSSKQACPDNRGKFPVSNDIEKRPEAAEQHKRIGDWEADTVVGKQVKACLVTLDDRKSRFLIIKKVPKKQARSVSKVMIRALEGVPVKTITPDRGKEFTDHASVTKTVLLSKTSPALAAGNR